MKAPQIIMIVLWAVGLWTSFIKNGEPRDSKYSLPATAIATAIEVGILIWGGFFG